METSLALAADTAGFERRYRSLAGQGRGYVFPCGADGRVDLAGLSDRARDNHLLSCSTVGFGLLGPQVCRVH